MADNRASKLPAKDDGPIFPLFNRLPWELRQMIWKHALPRPIPQILVYGLSTFSKWDPKKNTWDATDGPPRVPIPPPTLLHATHESREFTLKHVSIREERHWGPSPYEWIRVVSRPFDRERDAIFIHNLHFKDFVKVYMATTPWAARHLVLDRRIYKTYYHPMPSLRFWGCSWVDFKSEAQKVCRSLRSIALAAPNSCDDFLALAAFPDGVETRYYHAVPDGKAMAGRNRMCERLAAEFRGIQGPDGVPWKVRVGGGRLCGADSGEDDEEILECWQVVLERLTASTMDQD